MIEMIEMIEKVARAMEPNAFETYERGYTSQNYIAETAFLNAEKVVKRARKKARAAIAAMRDLTPEMGQAAYSAWDAFGEDATMGPEEVIAIWRAAIDEALTTTPPPSP